MNNLLVKIVLAIIALIAGFVVAVMFWPAETEPQQQKTVYDAAQEDKEKFLSKPKPVDTAVQTPQQQTQQQTIEIVTLYFKEIDEIEQIEAERLLNVAVPGRSIGRLPMTGFSLMVENCRQIIQRWPDSWFAFRAKQMLADMPERYHTQHHITEKDLDISRFEQQRPGTKPYEVEMLK
ncbi:MAG: hypothetical protein ACYSR3_08150 [Planctomycetota bacterium]|jgi:hypothetical protein